jgi:glycosyltransferase involved in cell wall biosynthesis
MEDKNIPLNILLANYRYFISGGPERYLFNVKKLFEEKGHNVIPFSVKHPKNRPSEYSEFFLSSLSDDESVTFSQLKLTPNTLMKMFGRTYFSFEAQKDLKKLLSNSYVDVAYILKFLRWISPSILPVFSRKNIPTVVRLSDFEYICPRSHLLRENEICELCLSGNFWPSIKYKCIQNSSVMSFLYSLSLLLHRKTGLMEMIDAFVCPSRFTLEKMVQAGFKRRKLYHVPTFIDADKVVPNFEMGKYLLYFGRISYEKGVDSLLSAFEILQRQHKNFSIPLVIIKISSDESADLEDRISSRGLKNVIIHKDLEKKVLFSFIENSACTIVPSIFYENMPNSILESFVLGKPVISSNIGSIPELVKDGETGLLYEIGNSRDMAAKILWLLDHPDVCRTMGKNARKLVEEEHNKALHHDRLLTIFKSIVKK